VREALRAGVPCIDCSGALRGTEEVPLRVAWLPPPAGAEGAPAIATPSAAALALASVLAPLHAAVPLRRVVATVLESAAAGGRQGIAALSAESLALFSQQESQESTGFGRPLAFDCHPALEPPEAGGEAPRERDLMASLPRLLGAPLAVAATVVQVPVFVGLAASLALELAGPLEVKEAEERLAQAPGVELWTQPLPGPNLRAAAGREVVITGRVRPDASVENGLQLWLVADALRLAAANAVALAVARLQSH
jgi:aspartate-semialdehyde dehydrogenase